MNETNKFSMNRVIKMLIIALLVGIIILLGMFCFYFIYGDTDEFSEDSSAIATEENVSDCNTQGITLHGELLTYISNDSLDANGYVLYDQVSSESIVIQIEKAEEDPNIKAILLDIDSTGGGPVAGQEIADALKRATKPTVALIREYGVSAAYYAATGADYILASKNSDVGGIGITMSYVDNVKQNQTAGLTYNSLSAGQYKDYGDPNKALTNEEKQMLMRDVAIYHDNFINDVATNRSMDVNKVKQLADGSSMPGQLALDNGLIDQLGSFFEAEQYLTEQLGEEAEICW